MPETKPDQQIVPSVEVKINGTLMPLETAAYLVALTVDDSVELPGMFTIELVDIDNLKKKKSWVDDPQFEIGAKVEVRMGYSNKLETVLNGEITALEPAFAFDRLPSLTVRGYDRRHRLQRGRKTRTFVQQKDSDIFSQIVVEAGLKADIRDSKVKHDYVLQANQTDFEFLLERARRIQFEIVTADNQLMFRPVANGEGEVLTMTLGRNLLEFYPRLTSLGQVSEVELRGWDMKEKKEILGKSGTGEDGSTMGRLKTGGNIVKGAFGRAAELVGFNPVQTQAEADQIAKARLQQMALSLITGEGVSYGRPDLKAGKVIRLDGLGDRFSGNYYVVNVLHRYSQSHGYQTHFSVRRNAL